MKKNRQSNTNEYAKNIFENGFVEFDYYEFVAFSKYADKLGWDRFKIENEIIRRCRLNEHFNIVINYDVINNATKKRKYKLLEDVSSVWITQGEIDFFKSIPEKYAKILFYILVTAKRDNPNYTDKLYYNYNFNDAIKRANVKFTEEEAFEFKFWCGKNNYLLATYTSIDSWQVMYSDINEGVIEINDFNKVMMFFPRWCKNCGVRIIKTGRSHKFCKDCSVEIRRDKKKLESKIYRDKKREGILE